MVQFIKLNHENGYQPQTSTLSQPPNRGSSVGCKYKLPCGMCEILKTYCTERNKK